MAAPAGLLASLEANHSLCDPPCLGVPRSSVTERLAVTTLDVSDEATDDACATASKRSSSPFRYVLLHKPRGVLTARRRDPSGLDTATVTEILAAAGLPSPERIWPVGRLDKDSEGLILLTNDGRLVTVFSASNYCGRIGNTGGTMLLTPSLDYQLMEHWSPSLDELLRIEMEEERAWFARKARFFQETQLRQRTARDQIVALLVDVLRVDRVRRTVNTFT